MIGRPGLLELVVILVVMAVILWPIARILKRAGFPVWLAAGAVIPGANLLLLYFVALAPWPALRSGSPRA